MNWEPDTIAMVHKYGSIYRCHILKVTPTRALVRITQRSGKVVERWVPQTHLSELPGWKSV